MRDRTVARSYAETLFELARREDAVDAYAEAMDVVARLIAENPRFRLFLETPRIGAEDKKAAVRRAFEDRLPRHVVSFVLVTIDRRRQRLLRDIAYEYRMLLDEHMGREHVHVTLARSVDDATGRLIAERLSRVIGKEAIPHIVVKPEIVGGLIVRTGDMIFDGSVRRHLDDMRRRLLQAALPSLAGARAAHAPVPIPED